MYASFSSSCILATVAWLVTSNVALGSDADTGGGGDGLAWHTDYQEARQAAAQDGRLLLIYFYDESNNPTRQAFEQQTLADPEVRRLCGDYTLLRVPTSVTVTADGQRVSLLGHRAFQPMNRRQGLAIVDFKHPEASYYRRAVSCLPFEHAVYYAPPYHTKRSIRTLLTLPAGTLPQRTMIYAVRLHPERPMSTTGTPHPVLFQAARQHSQHQARIRLQGHHNWQARSQQIHYQIGGQYPVEVVAESWPGKGLLAACIDCVHSWHYSSGHWAAVRAAQSAYGYDIRRGANGIWYATGIFTR